MFRKFAIASLPFLCMTPAALAGATFLLNAAPAARMDVTGTNAALVRDVGCIGYHGSASGYAEHGKCVIG